jgi:hypothetical protein
MLMKEAVAAAVEVALRGLVAGLDLRQPRPRRGIGRREEPVAFALRGEQVVGEQEVDEERRVLPVFREEVADHLRVSEQFFARLFQVDAGIHVVLSRIDDRDRRGPEHVLGEDPEQRHGGHRRDASDLRELPNLPDETVEERERVFREPAVLPVEADDDVLVGDPVRARAVVVGEVLVVLVEEDVRARLDGEAGKHPAGPRRRADGENEAQPPVFRDEALV